VQDTLESVNTPGVFAVGDVCHMVFFMRARVCMFVCACVCAFARAPTRARTPTGSFTHTLNDEEYERYTRVFSFGSVTCNIGLRHRLFFYSR
jgi:hypothetical protein